LPNSLSERMEGEDACFVIFIDLKRHKSFAYIPKNWDQNHVVHLKNLFGELG